MRFSAIPALTDVKAMLLRSAQSGHVAHAQLFAGVEGGAGLALALAYATYLNCENPTAADSCGACPNCSKNDKLIHPDLHFVLPYPEAKLSEDERNQRIAIFRAFFLANPYSSFNDWMVELRADNKQGLISREEANQLPLKAALSAFEGRYKVFVLWLPELLNIAAANALLKLLEEPPPATLFLLVTEKPGVLLPTILSRTQRVTVRAHTDDELAIWLETAHQQTPAVARAAAQLAEGSARAALLVQDEVGTELFDFLLGWLRLCYQGKWKDVLDDTSESFQKLGREGQKHLLRYGLGMVRKALLYGLDPALVPALAPQEVASVQGLSRLIHAGNADAITTLFTDACFHVERNANPKLVFFDTSLSLYPLLRTS